jgi:hypothetical protein
VSFRLNCEEEWGRPTKDVAKASVEKEARKKRAVVMDFMVLGLIQYGVMIYVFPKM